MQDHVGAAGGAGRELRRKGARAVRLPAHGFVFAGCGGARNNGHAVGNDEARIKAHAELTDLLRVLRFVGGEVFEEVFGARLRDGAEVFVRFLERHADAVVGNGEGAGFLVGADADREDGVAAEELGLRNCREAELVDGVGGVRDELAQEYFLIRIKGIGEELQELAHLGLENMSFSSHFDFFSEI